MTVFRSFLKILNKNKFIIIMYTVILVSFGTINISSNNNGTDFAASKPDILIINKDENIGITKHLIDYVTSVSNVKDIKNDEMSINDALFYRDVNYIIYIPENFRKDFLDGKNPNINIKKTGDYMSSLAEMNLKEYIDLLSIYSGTFNDEALIMDKIDDTLSEKVKVEVTSKLDTNNLTKAARYYDFANYSLLAGLVYVICLILSSFKEKNVYKRTVISSVNYKKYNRQLLLSNSLFALSLWFLYVLLSIIMIGNVMIGMHGIIFMINSLIFTICALTIAFLIGNVVHNKGAINGIVNVVALGSSFLCGAFVPVQYLPSIVLKFAHLLPSYYYISTNELLTKLEVFNFSSLKPILINMGMLLIFTILFIVVTNIISGKKRKLD